MDTESKFSQEYPPSAFEKIVDPAMRDLASFLWSRVKELSNKEIEVLCILLNSGNEVLISLIRTSFEEYNRDPKNKAYINKLNRAKRLLTGG